MKRFVGIMILAAMMLSVASPAMAGGCYYFDSYGQHAYSQDSFSYPTCTEPGYVVVKCTVCGDTSTEETGDAYGHTWDMIAETAATCTEKGKISYYCIDCGEFKTDTSKALGHKWSVQSTVKEATCTSKGSEKVKCSRCGKKTTRETDYSSHKYGEWVISVAATDCAMGQRSCVCSNCGKTQNEGYYPDGTLYRGIQDRKEEVKVLQTRLTECGYLNDTIDGIFGKKTEQAVKDFQTSVGVAVDGIAWPQSNKLLETEWQNLMGIVTNGNIPLTSDTSCCTRVENANGAVEFAYCPDHLVMMNAVNVLLEPDEPEQDNINALRLVRQLYQEEVDMLYTKWSASSSQEDLAYVAGSQATFAGYLSSQEMVWNKQYGENSEKALTKITDVLHNQMVELCSIIGISPEE